jgi:type VI secretion system protein ImpE
MNAGDLFKAGRLAEAVDAQIREVKVNPGDHNRRLFLFELLVFSGDLERAGRQIDAIEYGDVELDASVVAYRKLLDIEQARRRLLAGGPPPRFLSDPPDHVKRRLEALTAWNAGRKEEAARLLEEAAATAPAVTGTLNDKPFTGIRDGDDLFAAVLEVVAQGVYYWVPFEEVATLTINPPRFPRDLFALPARLEVKSGSGGDVMLPALYPGSYESSDDAIKLGRATDWKSLEGALSLGLGARVFLVGDDSVALLDWRVLKTG